MDLQADQLEQDIGRGSGGRRRGLAGASDAAGDRRFGAHAAGPSGSPAPAPTSAVTGTVIGSPSEPTG